MKKTFGRVIIDPSSEEAKGLVGKIVIASDIYTHLAYHPEDCPRCKLVNVVEECNLPFECSYYGKVSVSYPFVREYFLDGKMTREEF